MNTPLVTLTKWRWIFVVFAGIVAFFGLGAVIYQSTHEGDPHRSVREAYARSQREESSGNSQRVEEKKTTARSKDGGSNNSPAIETNLDLHQMEILPEKRESENESTVKPMIELSTAPQERKPIEADSAPAPVFEEPPIPQSLLDQTPPAKKEGEKIKSVIAKGRYRFNNQSAEALAGNVVVTEDHTAKDYNLETFAPEMEDIDLALMDNINSSSLELDVAAGVWTPFYFQGHKLLEIGDKLRGAATPGRQRDRLVVKFTKVIRKDGRSMPIQGISLAVDGTLGIPGEKVGNIFQAAAGPLLTELIKGVSETFQDRQRTYISGTGVTSEVPTANMKNAGIRGSQKVLDKIEELMSEEIEENKPYLFIRAGTRLRCRLQAAVDVSQVDYGK